MPSYSGVWTLTAQYQAQGAGNWPPNFVAPIGVFGGGFVGAAAVNTITFVSIETTGNSTDFGDLTVAREQLSSCSSSSRGLFGGGSPSTNVID
jgi:hypothetical protein